LAEVEVKVAVDSVAAVMVAADLEVAEGSVVAEDLVEVAVVEDWVADTPVCRTC